MSQTCADLDQPSRYWLKQIPKVGELYFNRAQQSVHRTAGGLRILSLIQARNLVPFRWLVLPAAGNAGRWAA